MDFEALMRNAVANNITVSTVALGKDADRTLMDAIAHWGQGLVTTRLTSCLSRASLLPKRSSCRAV